jgi:hypothetical protein
MNILTKEEYLNLKKEHTKKAQELYSIETKLIEYEKNQQFSIDIFQRDVIDRYKKRFNENWESELKNDFIFGRIKLI